METVKKQGAINRCCLIRKDLNALSISTNNKNIRTKINSVLYALSKLQQSVIKSTKEDWYEQRKT